MSGGSYNYLCFAEPDQLLNQQSNLSAMAERLADLGAADAAKATEEITVLIRHFLLRLEMRAERLKGVWQAVEWADSGDWGKDAIPKALAEYRKEIEP